MRSNNQQINPASVADRQAWFEAMLKHQHACHYFAVLTEDRPVYPFGSENAPYFTYEEAKQVLNTYKTTFPQIKFKLSCDVIDGTDHIFKDVESDNSCIDIWRKKHRERLLSLASPDREEISHAQIIAEANANYWHYFQIWRADGKGYIDHYFSTLDEAKSYLTNLKSQNSSTDYIIHHADVLARTVPETQKPLDQIESPYTREWVLQNRERIAALNSEVASHG